MLIVTVTALKRIEHVSCCRAVSVYRGRVRNNVFLSGFRSPADLPDPGKVPGYCLPVQQSAPRETSDWGEFISAECLHLFLLTLFKDLIISTEVEACCAIKTSFVKMFCRMLCSCGFRTIMLDVAVPPNSLILCVSFTVQSDPQILWAAQSQIWSLITAQFYCAEPYPR